MKIANPEKTVFYPIEIAIKSYRKMAQKLISEKVKDITMDQLLVLQYLANHPEKTQVEIALFLLKDNASMTRIVNVMVTKGYLERTINEQDRRRFNLGITEKGNKVLAILPDFITKNRKKALKGVTKEEQELLEKILQKIITNCKE